jgi:hypothetical protein
MRSLNTSLPSSPPKNTADLLQAFRSAALSVTTLYKQAAASETQSRQAGYQDALDDLLVFLDSKNIGLGDGEGWQIRQWATERLDGSHSIPPPSESDDEREEDKRTASPSPETHLKRQPETQVNADLPEAAIEPVRAESAPPQPTLSSQQHAIVQTRPETFTFRSSIQYPQEVEMQSADTTPETSTTIFNRNPTSTTRTDQPSMSRPALRAIHSARQSARRSLGAGAGSKRKVRFQDFFDISTIGDGKESGGGGKRNRLA